MWIYLNQRWLDSESASVSIWDRGFLYGESVYESLRSYQGKPYAFSKHYQRLKYSTSSLGIRIPISMHDMALVAQEGIIRNQLEEANIRIQLSAGRGHYQMFEEGVDPTFAMVFKALPSKDPSIEEEGVKVAISAIRRYVPMLGHAAVKMTGSSDILMARREIEPPLYDMIMLNPQGYIAEGTFSNVFMIKNKVLVTPSIESGILSGITREIVIQFASFLGMDVSVRLVELKELFEADQVFLTHTSAEIVPVGWISGMKKAVGRETKQLMYGFRDFAIKNENNLME